MSIFGKKDEKKGEPKESATFDVSILAVVTGNKGEGSAIAAKLSEMLSSNVATMVLAGAGIKKQKIEVNATERPPVAATK